MKKYLSTIFIVIISLIFILAIPLFLVISAFCTPPQFDETFIGELKYKLERLGNCNDKKVVIIGGSGVAFGIISPLAEELMPDYKFINMGMYAALGSKFILDVCEDEIGRGDIVVIIPEQSEQTLSMYFDGESVFQAADGSFELLKRVKRENLKELTGGFLDFVSDKMRLSRSGVAPEGVYSREAFDDYGDIKPEYRKYNIMPLMYDSNREVSYNRSVIDGEFIEYMNGFAAKVKKRGGSVYYRFAPVNRLSVKGETEDFYDFLYEELSFDILGDPRESVMDGEWFFDSNFHLNYAGGMVNTARLVKELKTATGDTSPTVFNPPEKPVPDIHEEDWNNSDEGCFEYADEGDFLTITGLSESGKNRKSLTVPGKVNGKTVKMFTRDAFRGTEFEELILQSNIKTIYDGSFYGCKNFKRLIILSSPSDCSVGTGLREGANFGIYVKKSCLNEYKLNYFWSSYAPYIYPYE